MKQIGIYGGSFNPPHLGHVQAARFAVEALNLDYLLTIPAGVAPHKQNLPEFVAAEHRLQMTRLAMKDIDQVLVSDLEIQRKGPSYSFQTVSCLREEHPDAELFLIMGTDMFLSFLEWKNTQQILKDVVISVLYRGESGEEEAIKTQKTLLEGMGGRVIVLHNPVLSVSSSDVRRMLAFRCAKTLLPVGVAAYIQTHNLYQAGENFRNLSMDQLEAAVVRLLNPNRVAHVLGCRDTCVLLARRWGADETQASRAGILHDITKALNTSLQLTLCHEYGIILDKFSQQNPKTLHALTGGLVADRIFGEDAEIVEAIQSHTTGKANMNLLQKIVYVADYMEPNRKFPGVEKLRNLAFSNLDGALQLGLEMTVNLLREQNREVSRESLEALNYLYTHRR